MFLKLFLNTFLVSEMSLKIHYACLICQWRFDGELVMSDIGADIRDKIRRASKWRWQNIMDFIILCFRNYFPFIKPT